MITCPHCGTLNRPTAKFCGSCGKQINIVPIAAESPLPGESISYTAVDAPKAAPEEESQPSLPGNRQDVVITADPFVVHKPDEPNAASTETPSQEDVVADSELSESIGVESLGTAAVQSLDVPITLANEQAFPEPTETAPVESPVAPIPVLAGQTAAEPSNPPAPASASAEGTQPASPLEIGAVLDDRFTILEIVSQEPDLVTYRARDAWRCPTCDFVNEPDAVFCSNCGRELNERGTVLLIERETSAELALAAEFVLNTRAYQIQPDAAPGATPDTGVPHVRLQFAVASDVGVVRGSAREPNEDSAFTLAITAVHVSVPHPTIGLFIIADGVGGSEAGELASKRAIQALSTGLVNTLVPPILQGQEMDDEAVRENIRAAILEANTQVMNLAAEKKNDMGTTATLAFVLGTRAYIANVGDSRTYLLRDAKLAPVTRDHSLVASLVSANLITAEEAYDHPQRNIILRSLGANTELEVDVFPLEGGALLLQPGDRLLLCSDGLWEMVRDFDLESILLREPEMQKAAATMIAAANESGGEDNVSLVIVSITV